MRDRIGKLFARIGRWGERPAGPDLPETDPLACGADDARRLTRALGASTAVLEVVETQSSTRLLRARMLALGLDPRELAASEPALLGEMEARCSGCQTRRRCLADFERFAAEPGWQGWREHCPNEAVLTMLAALQGGQSGMTGHS